MTVKLVVLKSGENLISEIKEGIIEDKIVCYILNDPCNIIINGSYKIVDTEDNKDNEDNLVNRISITLNKWPSLSLDRIVQLPLEWVVTIVEPNAQLKKLYEDQVLEYERINNQTSSSSESGDTDIPN